MNSPLISCIVPVFNGERYLKEALDSILAQTYRPLEIIVADDGSIDDTRAVVARYGPQVAFRSQSTAGPPAARNLGLRAAQGEFVAFLDQDDLWHREKLARQAARFAARPELDLCITYVRHFWVPELHREAATYRDHWRSDPLPGYYTGTLMARRTLFECVGQFNPTLVHSDATEWFLRAAENGAVMEVLPQTLTHKRVHDTNLSRREAAASREEYVQLVKASLDRRRRAVTHPPRYEFPDSYWQRKT
jgi:glycosyltransferase involved in cell wall biosynthesis